MDNIFKEDFVMYAALATTTPSITTEMLTPLIDGVQANIAVILPVGLGLFAIMIGVNLVPKLIRRFTNG